MQLTYLTQLAEAIEPTPGICRLEESKATLYKLICAIFLPCLNERMRVVEMIGMGEEGGLYLDFAVIIRVSKHE